MSSILYVFRERLGDYQCVGVLHSSETHGEAYFVYDPEYLALETSSAISLALPLQSDSFSIKETRTFFEGLLPEGELRNYVATSLRVNIDAFADFLVRLNNESIGALVFCTERSGPSNTGGYETFTADDLTNLAKQPLREAYAATMHSRLSLAGAQTKIGLYSTLGAAESSDNPLSGWYLPQGLAASTHIIKTPSEVFPLQTINEAFCLLVAGRCGFTVPDITLIAIENSEPLLAVQRFDRVFAASTVAQGLQVPQRLHQEDMAQAAGIPTHFKYEPTDGHYLSLVAHVINRATAYPLEDRFTFFDRILFDYLIGNCDNHLKNYSLLYSSDWQTCALAPVYDVTCTTFYPELAIEMGISLCASRRITDVAETDIRNSAQKVGIPETIAWSRYQKLRQQLPQAIYSVQKELEQTFPQVSEIAESVTASLADKVA